MTVAVILIGGAVLTINFGNSAQRLKEDAQRLAALLTVAADEAVLTNRELGIRFYTSSYAFFELDTQGRKARWKPIESDPRLRPRNFLEGVELLVEVDGTLIALDPSPEPPEEAEEESTEDDSESEADEIKPNVMMLSTGDILQTFSVTISLSHEPTQYTVRSGEESLIDLQAERES